jgi:hypothetical protein
MKRKSGVSSSRSLAFSTADQVTTCVVNDEIRLHSMLRPRHFDGLESTKRGFAASA